MPALAWGVGSALAIAGLVLAVVWRRSHAAGAALAERMSRPAALRDTELVYLERVFRISKPVGLVARLDRAYRLPSGPIVLMEYKTRWINQPSLSDVIQLSAQRLAMTRQTRQVVASHAYVMVKTPARATMPTAHRVTLMSDDQVVALIRRREDLLAGRALPRPPLSVRMCDSCSFRVRCSAFPL